MQKTLKQKIENYLTYFETGKRNDDTEYVFLKDNAPEELKESIRKAHGDNPPSDFVYDKYERLMMTMAGYLCNIYTIEKLEDYQGEIIDSCVDIYTTDLTNWLGLGSNNRNIYYLTEVLEESDTKDGFALLAQAQYKAIAEIYNEIINLLKK